MLSCLLRWLKRLKRSGTCLHLSGLSGLKCQSVMACFLMLILHHAPVDAHVQFSVILHCPHVFVFMAVVRHVLLVRHDIFVCHH